MKPTLTMVASVLALAACQKAADAPRQEATAPPTAPSASPGEPVLAPLPTKAPAGAYALDPSHTSLTFKLSHLGFSNYTAHFTKVSGKLAFDPARPAAMTVEATVDPRSLELNAPPKGFQEELTGEGWLDAGAFPAIAFKSTKVEPTGANTANVTGDLTLHGVTKPVVLAVTFNGGWAANAYDGARIGFSAKGTIKRSDFGIGFGLPAPGTNMGVGDRIELAIETEFASGKPTEPTSAN